MASAECGNNPFPDYPIKMSDFDALIDVQKIGRVVYPNWMTQWPDHNRERDQRVNRTRTAVLDAFIRLIFDKRYDTIRTADLIAEAQIGRSTFYEHFRSKDEVLLAAMYPVLLPLANAASGRGAKAQIEAMLRHIWEKRSVGRTIFGAAVGAKMQRHLATMILEKSGKDERSNATAALQAAAAAAAQMAMLKLWVKGEAACTADNLATLMIDCSVHTRPERRRDIGDTATSLG